MTIAHPNGLVLWQGPTQLPGQRGQIALIVTGLGPHKSLNRKTGPEAQAWVIPVDQGGLNDAVREGREAAVCGDCTHRPIRGGACYVTINSGPHRVWFCYQRRGYRRVGRVAAAKAVAGVALRWGAWGDPAAIPIEVYRPLLPVLRNWQGYTQQWRHLDAGDWGWLMASVHSGGDAMEAQARGWRTFRIRPGIDDPLLPDERVCPASDEGGHRLTCAGCGLCTGTRARRSPSVAIVVHGYRGRRLRDWRQMRLPINTPRSR
jgi:hypothetical protein